MTGVPEVKWKHNCNLQLYSFVTFFNMTIILMEQEIIKLPKLFPPNKTLRTDAFPQKEVVSLASSPGRHT